MACVVNARWRLAQQLSLLWDQQSPGIFLVEVDFTLVHASAACGRLDWFTRPQGRLDHIKFSKDKEHKRSRKQYDALTASGETDCRKVRWRRACKSSEENFCESSRKLFWYSRRRAKRLLRTGTMSRLTRGPTRRAIALRWSFTTSAVICFALDGSPDQWWREAKSATGRPNWNTHIPTKTMLRPGRPAGRRCLIRLIRWSLWFANTYLHPKRGPDRAGGHSAPAGALSPLHVGQISAKRRF